eukprot:CAMPEP_0185035784 /NCGR_PEP_ID=MMETSP1103-20130426/27758_1 /TAXON_ID=36769 /ORGANISM="Paraphysomonas bandaiensis, Strain Caron Lab Isolate" /LENGTH=521 /DNA_ID=CAMNT_0027573035 /DNA_START=105 /DNA_END=1670 /DNA_ORIENTATION=+
MATTPRPNADSFEITKRSVNYSSWYLDVIRAADMIDQSSVRGCVVLKPWSMDIWEGIRFHLDMKIKEAGAKSVYFPLLIPVSLLSMEADHVDGFAKECAVITHHRLCSSPTQSNAAKSHSLIPDPTAELDEPLVVRPTSEAVIWTTFQKWIHSYRDLPLKINQWSNVVRWEMRPRPFLRNSEFLWQEGHTAHSNESEAVSMAREMLDTYSSLCKNILALPVVKGTKSSSERFAGAVETFTIEGLMQNGWALQCGTSHFLGTNFSRAFNVLYQDRDGDRQYTWATSWGVSTRLIGAVIMTHSDDVGLVLPPAIAPVQVVFVPIVNKNTPPESKAKICDALDTYVSMARSKGIRCEVDDRCDVRPGAKYYEWERKGVPLRVTLGPKDIAHDVVSISNRVTGVETKISANANTFISTVESTLSDMQSLLYDRAKERLDARTFRVNTYAEMKEMLAETEGSAGKQRGGFYLVPWKDSAENELRIKEDCKVTLRCFPDDYNKVAPTTKCFYCNEPATHFALFARAY